MRSIMEEFKGLFEGQVLWVIGKGPSLQYLAKEHIGPGPVITINQSIIKAEEIGLPNPVFSMQKDGGNRRRSLSTHNLSPDCDYTPNCGDRCGRMIRPKQGATLLVHKHESLYCFPDYSPRYVFDWMEFGLPKNPFSLIIAVKLGILMGCDRFRFVSCDVHVNGSLDQYAPGIGIIRNRPHYRNQPRNLKPYLAGLDCKWIIPVKKMDANH